MASSASHPSSPTSPPTTTSARTTSPSTSPDPRDALRALLRQTLRVRVADGRIFLGTFVGTDRALNVLLASAHEYRLPPAGPAVGAAGVGPAPTTTTVLSANEGNGGGRFVGQIMLPWRLVRSVEVEGAAAAAGLRGWAVGARDNGEESEDEAADGVYYT
jgi:N-alpha-acetyltransferase 38, NatC auxiliary subunit